jgi:hypothetical protein
MDYLDTGQTAANGDVKRCRIHFECEKEQHRMQWMLAADRCIESAGLSVDTTIDRFVDQTLAQRQYQRRTLAERARRRSGSR